VGTLKGSGYSAQGLGTRSTGSGYSAQGLGFRYSAQGSGIGTGSTGSGYSAQGLGIAESFALKASRDTPFARRDTPYPGAFSNVRRITEQTGGAAARVPRSSAGKQWLCTLFVFRAELQSIQGSRSRSFKGSRLVPARNTVLLVKHGAVDKRTMPASPCSYKRTMEASPCSLDPCSLDPCSLDPELSLKTQNAKQVVVDEITLIGSRCGPFALALKLLEMRRVSVSGLITHRFPLAQAGELKCDIMRANLSCRVLGNPGHPRHAHPGACKACIRAFGRKSSPYMTLPRVRGWVCMHVVVCGCRV
jgi:hypothetical protein